MTSPAFRRTAAVALLVVACAVRAQEAKLDAKSKELIDKADAALAKAKSISLVQKQRVFVVKDRVELTNERGPETAILAARPSRFRVQQQGETAEYTVSPGTEWVRYIKEANAYQRKDVSKYDASVLYRAPQPLRLLRSRRGLVSLWLGGHSLRSLLPGQSIWYDGIKRLHGTLAHRIAAEAEGITYHLYLSTTESALPLFFVGTGVRAIGRGAAQVRVELAFEQWKLNPTLPEGAFAFTAPKGARQVSELKGMGDVTEADRAAWRLTDDPNVWGR